MKYPPKNLFSLTVGCDSTLSISNLKLQKLKIEVADYILQLRQGINLNPSLIESIFKQVEENLFALAYIGLDEQSLREIDVLESKIKLQEWLKVLRQGTTLYKNYLRCLYQEVDRLGLTLAELKTDKQELKKLEILGFKLSVAGWLKRIADGDYNSYFVLINFIREQVAAYELNLADVGTSEEELRNLMVFAAEKEALSWLKHLRESNIRNEYFTENIMRNVAIGGFPLEKIGTSKKEIQNLLARSSESKQLKVTVLSKEKTTRQEYSTEILFKIWPFFKVLTEVKKHFSWKATVWFKTLFSHLQSKTNDSNLIHYQH